MQTKYSSDPSIESNKHIWKNLEEKSTFQLNTKNSEGKIFGDEKEKDITDIKFPIDNSEFNFMIIDANLGIVDNLNNLFFLEFDIANSSSNKEKLKFFREINNESVEREIVFVLNVKLYLTKLGLYTWYTNF